MARVKEITAGVYQVGGDGLSRAEDCCVYLVDGGGDSALIDTGAGRSASMIWSNIIATGIDMSSLKHIELCRNEGSFARVGLEKQQGF